MSADQPQPDATLPALRPYQAGDEAALTALFAAAYGHPLSEALYRWKLTGLPSPTPNVWAAWEQDRPIFHYARIPTPVSYTHLRAHETVLDLVCRLLPENKNDTRIHTPYPRATA